MCELADFKVLDDYFLSEPKHVLYKSWQTLKAAVLTKQTTNSAMDAIALCKVAANYYEKDLPFTDIKWLKLLDKMAGVAQQHQ